MSRGFANWTSNPLYRKLTTETKEHASLAEWLNWIKVTDNWFHYPSGFYKTPTQKYLWAIMGARKNVPDFLFFDHHQGFCGLALEYKKTGRVIHNKDGSLRADMRDQFEFLEKLKAIGWRTELVAGKEPARQIIADYYGIKL